jgi:hypothetical protein
VGCRRTAAAKSRMAFARSSRGQLSNVRNNLRGWNQCAC